MKRIKQLARIIEVLTIIEIAAIPVFLVLVLVLNALPA